MNEKILVTRMLPEKGMKMLKDKYSVTVNPYDRIMTKEEILEGIKGKDGLLCLLTDTIDEEIISASPSLKIISNYAVGFNNIDIKAATKRDIVVTNTPGVLTESTADLAFALLMAIARRIPEGDRLTRAGLFKGWGPLFMLGDDVYGKTLGILGMGRIGKALAKRASGFDMKILYYNRNRLPIDEEKALFAEYATFNHLLKNSDYLSIHIPLCDDTKHLIGEKELSLMKKDSFLINTSRGPVVDENALFLALQNGVIKGAALDVYENEPEVHPGLIELQNVILAPHVASATIETRTKMAVIAAENLINAMEGRKPEFVVNPEVLTKCI